MAVKTGRLGWIGVAKEITPGVAVNPADYIPFLDETMMDMQSVLPDVAARGVRDEQSENSQLGKQWGQGTIKVNVDSKLAGYFLGGAMGQFNAPVSEGNGVYTHTITRNNSNSIQTLSLIVDRVTDRELYAGAVVNTAEINFSDGLAELSTDLISNFPQTSVSGTLATASGNIFSFNDAQIQLGVNIAAAIASPVFIKARAFDVKIENNVDAQFVSGYRNPDSIIAKNFKVSGSLRLAFEDTTQKDAYNNLTKSAMVVTFNGNGIGNNMNEFVKLRFYKIRSDAFKIAAPIDDIITQEIDFVAEYSSIDSATLDIQLRNNKSSY